MSPQYFRAPEEREQFEVIRQDLRTMGLDRIFDAYTLEVRGPTHIVIRLPEAQSEVAKIEGMLYDIYSDLRLKYPDPPIEEVNIIKGRCYTIYSRIKRSWVRAMATKSMIGKSHKMKFELLDHGLTETRQASDARQCPDIFCVLPAQGHRIRILESNECDLSGKETSILREHLMKKLFRCEVLSFNEDTKTYRIQLYIFGKHKGRQLLYKWNPVCPNESSESESDSEPELTPELTPEDLEVQEILGQGMNNP